MKNLIQLGERTRKLSVAPSTDDGAGDDSVVDLCLSVANDLDLGPATVALSKNGILSKINSVGEVLWTRKLQDLDPSCGGGGWFNLAYVDPELVCLSKHGAMVTVTPSTGEAELIGVFDYGLEAATWSPDGEVLLMVTSAADDDDDSETKSVLMTMNAQFEVMAEITIPTYLASSAAETARISVAWRPDGTLCAVSAIDASDNVRKVRTYKRETLELHAIGRAEDASGTIVKNLQDSGLSWASPGCSQVLAAVQRKGKKTHQVVFFESNGLRHREFLLREAPSTIVTSLTWNFTSDLLAVALREEDGTDKVQLWHRCNYHWYMKQEMRYPNQAIQSVKFHDEKAYEFYVLLQGMEWREYQVQWDPSTTLAMDEQCPAFVVDGASLNITPLEKALIPPPMFMRNLTMDFPITDVCFCRGLTNVGCLLVQLSNGELVFLLRGEGAASYQTVKIVWKESLGVNLKSLRSFVVVGSSSDGQLNAVAIAPASANQEVETLVEILITDLKGPEAVANITNTTILEDRVLRMVNWSDTADGCLVELLDGSLLEYEQMEGGSTVQPSDAEPLLEPCPWICAIKDSSLYSGLHHDSHPKMVFGLSTKSRLYFHDMMLTDSASSFYLSISHEFLCYATNGSRCFLRFLPLKEINSFDPLMGMDQNHMLEGYEPRSVERGARVVAILPSQPMAVLQMPRGNLEGVFPRALVVRFVMLQIAQGQYGKAFTMMRKHKVDLNLLVDFDPWHFSEKGISTFFQQVSVIDHLNLFLSGLQDWDITQSRFPVPGWLRRENLESKDRASFDFSTKVNQICRKSRATMFEMEQSGETPEAHFLLPVLSTFAKESPPKLDEALSMIKERALQHHPPNSKKPPLFAEKAQNAIHYLAFLAEYELLFETALGMHDYEIARAVARNSQMDPKVYLPLLKRLNSLPTMYAKYEVDVRLKRYEAALNNLYQSNTMEESLEGFDPPETDGTAFGNSFENCMSLIEKHKLYTLALTLFQNDSVKTRTILISLGVSLLDDRKPDSALSVFLAADPPALEDAKRAARAAGNWRTFFSLLTSEVDTNGDSSEEVRANAAEQRRQIARDIAKEITAKETEFATKSKQGLHSDASRILLDYGDDLFGAVDMLVNAECWSEAHRIAASHSRPDLVKRCTDGAIEYAHTAIDEFQEKSATFLSTTTRYDEVLLLRKKNVFEEGPALDEADETGSLFSAASNMSNMSLQSATSTTSTGSGVSSIISVKSTTTFTMTSDDAVNRHRSKFNKGKKQKTRKKKGKNRKKPGSQEELNSLVFTLKSSCPSDDYARIIAETIHYLIRVKELALASEVYKSYNLMRNSISATQAERMETTRTNKLEAERRSRIIGEEHHEDPHILVELPVEKEVDELSCPELDSTLVEFFGFLSIS
jgi:elongator complex protein 1